MRTVQRHPDVVDATVESELVVMNIHSFEYFRFNEVAKSIWNQLSEGPRSEDEIIVALMAEYEVDAAVCHTALTEFLDHALERQFLRIV
jgi:hypothetical protein